MARPRLDLDLARWTAPLRRNVPAKLLAAGIAFTLWFFVNTGQRDTQVLQFPVELQNLPEGSIVANTDRVDVVEVKLNGPGPLLASLDARRFPIHLDLGDAPIGPSMRRKIRDHMIHLPRGVRILEVDPSRVPVRLEKVVRRTLPVSLTRTGNPRAGYRIREIEVMPREVVVSGPASVVERLTTIETDPVELDGTSSATQRTVTLTRTAPLVTLQPQRVTVNVAVEQIMGTRTFAKVPVAVRNVDRPFRLRPSRVKLTVRGPKAAVEALELRPESVFVDGAARGVGEYELEPETDLPAGIALAGLEPASVRLELLKENETQEQE
jgi:hypothetical protein